MLDPAQFFLGQVVASPHVQFIYDLKNQQVVFVNEAYERVLQGHSNRVNEELPALLSRIASEDMPLLKRYWRLWCRGLLQDEIEIRLRTAGEPDQWLCLEPHWHQQEDGQVWLGGTLRDNSVGRLNLENRNKFSSKKNTVLEILSHDLAGAFVMLQQLTKYVQQEVEPSVNPQVREMLALMQDTSQRSVAMIHDLVDQEFLESSEIPLRRERVNLGEKIDESLEPFRRTLRPNAQQLLFEQPIEPVYAVVDINKLQQVIANLLGNALKFTPDGGRITLKLGSEATLVRLSITDNGIGIPAFLHAGLFDRFTHARRPGLRGEPTTGLGLSLCKLIVELHQGTLTVESEEGKGTTFHIALPTATN